MTKKVVVSLCVFSCALQQITRRLAHILSSNKRACSRQQSATVRTSCFTTQQPTFQLLGCRMQTLDLRHPWESWKSDIAGDCFRLLVQYLKARTWVKLAVPLLLSSACLWIFSKHTPNKEKVRYLHMTVDEGALALWNFTHFFGKGMARFRWITS
jgi:hypothetical protein